MSSLWLALALLVGASLEAAEVARVTLSFSGEKHNAVLILRGEALWEEGDSDRPGMFDAQFEFFGVDDEKRERLHAQAVALRDRESDRVPFEVRVNNLDRVFNEDKEGMGNRLDEIVCLVTVRYYEPGARRGAMETVVWSNQVQGSF